MEIYGYKLRLVISKKPSNSDEPWYLLTNLDIEPKKIIKAYAKRWQIETMFRDSKLWFNLKHARNLKLLKKGAKRLLLLYLLVLIGYILILKRSFY